MLSVGSTRVEALKLSRTALKFLETQLGSKPLPDEFDDGPSNFSVRARVLLRAVASLRTRCCPLADTLARRSVCLLL